MAKYQYVDSADKLQTVEAPSAEAAMAAAKDIGKSSGVMLAQPKVNPKPNVDAGRLGKNGTPTVPTPKESGAIADASYAIGVAMPGVQDAKNAAAAFTTQAGPIETAYADLLASMQKDISGVAGKSARQAELMKSEGVNANKELLNQYTKQLEQEQRNLKKTTDAINNGELGFMTSGYANKKLQDIQRQSLSRQADIAILANAAQGNISTAMDLVDQKLQIEYGEKEDRIALQKQYLELVTPLLEGERKRIADQRAIEVGLYQDQLASERETARMKYQAELQRQNAAYESSLRVAENASASPSFNFGDDSSKYGQALSFALTGSSMPLKAQAQQQALMEQYVKSGDFDSARELIIRNATESLTSTEKQAARGRAATVAALSDIKGLLDEYKNSGGSTNLLKGSLMDAAAKIGATTDPKLSEIGARMNVALINYRRAVSGAAFTESESKVYDKIFPNWGNTESLNAASIDGLLGAFDSQNRSELQSMIGGKQMYDSLFSPKDRVVGVSPSTLSALDQEFLPDSAVMSIDPSLFQDSSTPSANFEYQSPLDGFKFSLF